MISFNETISMYHTGKSIKDNTMFTQIHTDLTAQMTEVKIIILISLNFNHYRGIH